MKNMTRILIFNFFFLFSSGIILSQPSIQWVKTYNGYGNYWDEAVSVITDDSNNIYVTGGISGIGANNFDYATIKYKPNGDTSWIRLYASPGSNMFDAGRVITISNTGYVYVSGAAVTLKYDRNGTQLWVSENNADSKNIEFDSLNNIYTCGSGNEDYTLNKFDTNGVRLWQRRYNGPGNNQDRVGGMTVDRFGNIVVTGGSWGLNNSQYDYATVKYNSNGDTLWERRYNGPAPLSSVPTDIAYAVTTDHEGNAYVTGLSDDENNVARCYTIKYSPTGETIWSRSHNLSIGYKIMMDNNGQNLYITGIIGGGNFLLLKYTIDGDLLWEKIISPGNIYTPAPTMILDNSGNIYLGASRLESPILSKLLVVKFDSLGNRLWDISYDHRPMGENFPYALALDKQNNVIAAGSTTTNSHDYLIIKISQLTGLIGNNNEIPDFFKLQQNYPNPFNPSTTINYELPLLNRGAEISSHISLKIYDVLGSEIATLVDEKQSAGKYSVEFDVRLHGQGSELSSGIYFYTLKWGNYIETKSMILIK